jgi:hypothetical protein
LGNLWKGIPVNKQITLKIKNDDTCI